VVKGPTVHEQSTTERLTNLQKRRLYLDSKYVQIDGNGVVYITEEGTKNREALKVIMEELWSKFVETD
jgi:hypothetical protein